MGNEEVFQTEIGERLSMGRTVGMDVNVQGSRIRAGHVVPGVYKAMDVVRGLSHNEGTFRNSSNSLFTKVRVS
jgi:hypothetical protein